MLTNSNDPRDIVANKLAEQNKYPMDHFRTHIDRAIDQNGQYTHNIISINLRQCAAIWGFESANALIDEYCLDDIYGIQKQELA